MIEFLAMQFDKGKKYTEKEVNAILNQHHSFNDPATLRRLLFGTGIMNRTVDGRSYWLAEWNSIVRRNGIRRFHSIWSLQSDLIDEFPTVPITQSNNLTLSSYNVINKI